MIKQETIDKILDAARIEEVVGDFVDLRKRGTSMIGLCPFHNEKTPSFHVSVSKGIYKCFGCGAGGDAVRFVMELEKYAYPEALRYLAQKYNIEVEETAVSPEQAAVTDHRESLLVVTNWASKFFRDCLWDTDDGRAIGLSYFRERGYREDIIKKFELGYSPEAWEALHGKAIAAGHDEDFLQETGLIVRKDDGKSYDRFRGRVMFPIHNLTGRVLGFGGRTLKTDKKVPKYVNSPESIIYHKSDVLYGLFFAKKAITVADSCYLVEGYADVISMHQAGVENVVASSGTSLTSGQIRLIARYTKNVTILFDGDAAGIKASLRGLDMLLEEGMNVKVLLFPDGDDPDSFAMKNGADAFKQYIEGNSKDFIFYKTDVLLKDAGTDPVKRAEVIHDVVESIALIPDDIKASVFIRECSNLLDIEERLLISELNKLRLKASRKDQQLPEKKASSPFAGNEPPPDLFMDPADGVAPSLETTFSPKVNKSQSIALQEREIIRLLLNYGHVPAKWEQDYPIAFVLLAGLQDVTFTDALCQKVVTVYLTFMEREELPNDRYFITHKDREIADLAITLLASPYSLSPNWNDEKRKIYVAQETDNLKNAVLGALYRIKKRKVEQNMQDVREELRQETNAENLEMLMVKYQKLKMMEKEITSYLGTVIVK
ncbi:DNA primase [Olivibacter sp. SDN3]|uniref:DNA primase n=1 Tax=Olivibacter sp. SDN3 TaxID=2764720 RepID=UPI0016517EA4|nr:DNA primase [Olivibacter sp. SDN3]QNL50643.1 DNA primase [Olivibacter sp. SDN3]